MEEVDNEGNSFDDKDNENTEDDSKSVASGEDEKDDFRQDDTLASFSERHRIPVNEVRAANPESVDEYGNVTGVLKVPEHE